MDSGKLVDCPYYSNLSISQIDNGTPASWKEQTTGTTGKRSRTKARDTPANESKDDPYREYVLRLSASHLSRAEQEGHTG
jgi:hypothetical protein